jgi:hypothetical protein
MGFLTRLNPKATWKTAVFQGAVSSVFCTGLYVAVLWWNGWWEYWPFKLSICAAFSLLVGAVFEWQVADEDEDDMDLETSEIGLSPSLFTTHSPKHYPIEPTSIENDTE